ncbi:MAG: ATP-binding protein, partial [Sphingomicrobium sp.]
MTEYREVRIGQARAKRLSWLGAARWPSTFALFAGLALAVFATACLGVMLTRFGDRIASVWLANAVVVAVLLRFPARWRGAVATALSANIVANLSNGDNLVQATVLSLLNSVEILLVAVPLSRRFTLAVDLGEARSLGALMFYGGIVGPAVSAAGAAIYLTGAISSTTIAMFTHWFTADALGLLTLTPLLLAIPERFPALPRLRSWFEPLATLAVLGGVTLLVFTQTAPLLYVIFVGLIFGGFRLGLGGSAFALAMVAGLAVLLTLGDSGPIAALQADPAQRMFVLQGFIAAAMIVTLPVNAIIRERDRLLTAANHARDAARAAAEAKSNFLATMSHEIRTPMTGVLGMIELLRSDPAGADRDRYLATLKQSANLLMTVLDDILDFSKLESGNLQLETSSFSFVALAQATLDLFGNAASMKGLLISMQCDCPEQALVRGDPIRIQQVMSNLISNAIKFTEHGRITIMVRAGERVGDARNWRVEVSDTGIGIAPEQQNSLFQPFVQAETSIARRFGGTGLGLAISRWLVEAMDGSIGVESGIGLGATFWFEIPLVAAETTEWNALPSTLQQASRSLRILVAEDNPVNQMLIEAFVRTLGHRTLIVPNGRHAVEAAERETFDCILMDMQMPEMDGMAATRAIRSTGGPCAAIPIIALTADASPERRRFYDNVGLTDFLTKPIDRLALAARLSAIAGPAAPIEEALPLETSDAPLLDTTNINLLCAAIGPTNFDGLLDLLEVELAERPAMIRSAIAVSDTLRARTEAHSLKGAASSVGAMAL